MPPKVIHIVEQLDRGAVETWLIRMLRHARRNGVALDWTFYCALGQSGITDEEAMTLGARVIHSPVPLGSKAAFAAALRRELSAGGYNVLHCHHDLISSLYLAAAIGVPVGRRIVHVHNADEDVPTPSRLKQALFREPMRRLCLMAADQIVGISNHTLDTFLAGRPRRVGRDIVHYYGVDPSPFRGADDREAFRQDLALPASARLLLFAGRLVPEKNPTFAIDVLAAIRRRDPTVFGVFAGAGSIETQVRVRAEELRIAETIRFLGWRSDVASVMSVCDWFILPRPEQPMEGFGLAVVEAQLAGLRLLLSRGIPDDPLLPTAVFRRVPLAAGAEAWASAALEMWEGPAPSREAALAAHRASPMDMDEALADLLRLYV